ncbi:MAG TPA: c-type cytochrome [Burkholderiales bacterium]|nr:c-type cytochrome [Burkholderiales bacterium]
MRIAVFLAVVLLCGSALAQDKAPSGSAERGKKLFVDLACYSCHGTHGQGGGRGSEPTIPAGYPWVGFLNQMRKPRLDMPAYEEKWVSDQDVADMFAYFTSLKPAPAAKDIPQLRNF